MRAALPVLAALLAAALPAADDAGIVFRPESLQVALRRPLGNDPPRPDHRLTLYAELPRERSVLRLEQPRFAPVASDGGERLGLLVRSANRVRPVAGDRQSLHDRRMRLILDLTPPHRPTRSLLAVRGSVAVVVGDGTAQTFDLPLTPAATPVPVPGLDGGTVRVETVDGNRATLLCSAALAARLADVEARDAAGVLLPARPTQPRPLPDGALRLTIACYAAPATVRLAWFATPRSLTVAIDIPRLDIPGGLPGIGDTADPPPGRPGGGPGWTTLHQAVQTGDAVAAALLLGQGADPWAEAADGRNALDLARDQGRWRLLAVLLGNPPEP